MTTDERPDELPSAASPAGRWLVTGYAGVQVLLALPMILLFVLWVLAGVLALVWVGLAVLVGLVPVTRAVANLHRRMAGRVLGQHIPDPYRPLPAGGPMARLRVVAADPMTWRDLGWLLVGSSLGLALSLVVVLLLAVVVTWFVWWYAAPPLMQARARLDRFFLAYSRTERLEQRVQVLTETRADVVDHSAAELRRLERDLHDGTQARLVALSMSLGMAQEAFDDDPAKAPRPGPRTPARPPPPQSPTCARWCAASTPRCWRTADWAEPSRPSHSTWRSPSTWRSTSRAARRRPSSRRSTSAWPSVSPTSASTPARGTRGSVWPTGRADCGRSSATTEVAAPHRTPGPACWG